MPPIVSRIVARLGEDDLLRRFARGGLAALAIKLAAAGLSFAMFLVLARATTVEAYGLFGFAFSLSWMLAVAGSCGQWMGALRWIPAYAEAGETALLRGAIRYGYLCVLGGCAIAALGATAAGALAPGLAGPVSLMAMAGLLTLAQGWAEYQTRLMRSLSGMVFALAPRDVLWRILVIAAAGGWMLASPDKMSAVEASLLVGGSLLLVAAGQALAHPATRPDLRLRAHAEYRLPEWNAVSLGLWGASLTQMLGPYFSVVLVGLLLPPEEVAGYFAALRLAMLMDLFPLAVQMASASMISSRWAAGDVEGVRRICRLMALVGAAPALAGFALFAVAGDVLMGLFGAEFADAAPMLVVLGAGFLFKSVMGQANVVLQLAGQERRYLVISGVSNLAGNLGIVVAAQIWGGMGAALCVSAGLLAMTVWSRNAAMTRLGVDTSVLAAGPLLRRGLRALRRRGG